MKWKIQQKTDIAEWLNNFENKSVEITQSEQKKEEKKF